MPLGTTNPNTIYRRAFNQTQNQQPQPQQAGYTPQVQSGYVPAQQNQQQGSTIPQIQSNGLQTTASPGLGDRIPYQSLGSTDTQYTGLQTQDPLTQAGKLAYQRITQGLQGQDPTVLNAQNTADTNVSRRNYVSNFQTQDQAAQAGFAPGSLQYQRASDRSRAGADIANLGEQQGVNQLAREVGRDNINSALGIENTIYNRATGERDYRDRIGETNYRRAFDERGYRDTVSDRNYNRGLIEQTRTDDQTRQLIDSVKDPKAQNALRSMFASGGDVNKFYSGMFDNGTLKPEFRSQTPIADAYDSALEQTKYTNPKQPGETDEQWLARIGPIAAKKMADTLNAKDKPITDPVSPVSSNAIAAGDIEQKIKSGGTVSDQEWDTFKASDKVAQFSSVSQIPTRNEVSKFLETNKNGYINIQGTLLQLKSGAQFRDGYTKDGDWRHDEYAEVYDPKTKKTYYYTKKGKWYSQKPVDKTKDSFYSPLSNKNRDQNAAYEIEQPF